MSAMLLTRGFQRIKGVLAVLLLVLGATQAAAQQIPPLDVERDPNQVDMLSGKVAPKLPTVSIPAAPELTFQKMADFIPKLEGRVGTSGPTEEISYSINAGSIASDSIRCTQAGCTGAKGSGSTVFGGITVGPFHFTEGGSGTKIRFDVRTFRQSNPSGGDQFDYLASRITNPGGPTLTFAYSYQQVYAQGEAIRYHRPASVTSSSGYALIFTYRSDTFGDYNPDWFALASVKIVKVSDPSTPLSMLTYTDTTATDIDGRVFQCTNCRQGLAGPLPTYATSLRLPGESIDQFSSTYTETTNGHDLAVTTDGVNYNYDFTYDPNYSGYTNNRIVDTAVITGPGGFYRSVDVENTGSGRSGAPPRQRIKSITNSQGQVTRYEYDNANRVTKITYPELNSVSVTYDISGNVTSLTRTPKPGSGQTPLVQEAFYNTEFECANVTCFLPAWTKDAKGNQTDYSWDPSHGGLIWQLDPANAQNQRRKVKYTYDTSGRPITEEVCAATSTGTELTCGTVDSFLKTTTYWESTRLPLSETVSDGLGGGPLTTTYTYGDAGRLKSQDGPLPGNGDAVFNSYDILGRKIWEVGPLGEANTRPATKTTYRAADDQIEKVETGYVNATDVFADAAGNIASFTLTALTETTYNSKRLVTRSSVKDASGIRYSVTQITYDTRNRELCVAVRMNPANWQGTGSSDACALRETGSTGPNGPDRITRKTYDTESRVTKIQQAVGTTLQRDYATYTFTPNGQVASMTDARGYMASMLYDGFDRQTHWYFPKPNVTGDINPNDYERYEYDANGNRTKLVKRDGSVITYTYDKLNRVTLKTVPERAGLDPVHTRDVYYRYDIRGLQDIARFDNIASGDGVRTFYDTYGRVTQNYTTIDGVSRNLWYQYDAAGNRTQVKYPDSKVWNYSYGAGGQFNQLTDQTGNVLADFDYNAENQLEWLRRADGAPDQEWKYDPVGRLEITRWQDAGANSVSWSFTRNPASQILTETRSNDAYSWDRMAVSDVDYQANGLNQYTTVDSLAFCYDANGNLTRDKYYAYLYDVENRMVEMRDREAVTACPTATSGYAGQLKASLGYDPLGRLTSVTNYVGGISQGPIRFLHDGDALVAEYNSAGTMLQRHVHGLAAGVDDPLVTYSGTSNAITSARFLYADPRGSIVYSASSTNGAPVINTYDVYGIPGTGNSGRFQYTGQVWLPEIGLYYYKARIYSPSLGRFLQTDPIGYEDDSNLYAYVGDDPINKVDPTGTSDLNLFHSTDTLWLAGWAFEPNGEDDSVFTITGHGSARGIVDNRDDQTKRYLTATELASEARANGLKQGVTAFLGACNVATGYYARDFAIALKSTVIAANGFVMFPSARKGYRPDTYNGKVSLYVSQTRDGKGPRGKFLQYNSKGQVTKTWDRATFNAKTGRVTFSNDTPQTGTRIPERRSQCVSKKLCGGE